MDLISYELWYQIISVLKGQFEEAPLPPGHAFFHGEKEAPHLRANVVLAIGNCGLYQESTECKLRIPLLWEGWS